MAAGSASATASLSVAAAAAVALCIRQPFARAPTWAAPSQRQQRPLLKLRPCASSVEESQLFDFIYVNGNGATMAIYDVMQLVRADVSTIGLGIAGSTASIILGGGTKGKRFAMPNTRIMIHQLVGGASGQALDVEVQAKEILSNKRNVIRLVSGFTGRTLEQVETITWVLLRLLIMDSSMV
ncbi:ATP-dependent Clp protease proteolytic subunit 4, chloroplastic-like [Phragmites australis]|uniref:ATP-dependent Clp protease proteolytic subunit 4, chloroplastic-like n=1 Tax=Phragmites australis TaxID=29695 RepID=UPI002D76EFDC|nr:ATP-dependent Clp protease proteolytic subunit 4, chloroplastic-like [Phragmites australis]